MAAARRTQPARAAKRRRLEEPGSKPMTYPNLLQNVKRKLPVGLLDLWKDVVKESELADRFWGEDKRSGWIDRLVTLAIYRDLTNLGYERVLKSYDVEVKMSHKSFEHNTQIIRRILRFWAMGWIPNEGAESWNDEKAAFGGKGPLEAVNLVMDSVDFRLQGKRGTSRKDPKYSYKLNAPGQRYQALFDARGIAQGLWGGYSPKVYDGESVRVLKEVLRDQYEGARIAADCHYGTCNKTMKSFGAENAVKFYTPVPKPPRKKTTTTATSSSSFGDDPTRRMAVLTQQQEAWNAKISKIRGRVESPFGIIKRRWASLREPFREDEEQQDHLVWIAIATENYRIIQRE